MSLRRTVALEKGVQESTTSKSAQDATLEELRQRVATLETALEACEAEAAARIEELEGLNASLRLFMRAMEACSEGIAILDVKQPNFPLIYVNAGFERQTGYKREEVLNKSARFIHGPGTNPKTVDQIRSALEHGNLFTTEILSYRKDGSSFWNRISLTPLRNKRDQLTHFVSIQSDVTSRIQSNLEIQEALNLLEETNIKLTRTNKWMRSNLEAAAKVQQALLPEQLPKPKRVRFAWQFHPCDELAGDILNIFRLDDDHVGLYLLDVTGHGTAAALLAVSVFRLLAPMAHKTSLVRERIEETGTYVMTSPAEVAQRLNRQFPWDFDTGQFFTLVYGVLNVKTLLFRFITAGHPGPIYYPASGEPVVMPSLGLPIGLTDGKYEEQVIQLNTGDRLLLYSDGVTEAMSPDGELFGRDRLIKYFNCKKAKNLDDCLNSILNATTRWKQSRRFHDDFSLLGLEVRPKKVDVGSDLQRPNKS